ncbi:hypothetical protein [Haloarcula sp. CBA1122]|uniref:hypothetical protein n=1 Tax=Haloarcula sp. CBA1122 TaxID=2668069 RepID=UPI002090AE29|nr:hypothetical protein [Haloarcula sp. CBA1122]
MKWRCEWCGKPHEEDDPPCDNCGHGSFEEAVTQVNEAVVEGGPRWVCLDCGRQHQKNSPPCKRCGGSNFERRTGPPEDDPLDEIQTGWLDVLETKYAIGYAAVALLLGLIVLAAVGGITLPGFAAETPTGPPSIASPAGSGDTVDSLSLAEVEDTYVDVYTSGGRASAVERSRGTRPSTTPRPTTTRAASMRDTTTRSGPREREYPGSRSPVTAQSWSATRWPTTGRHSHSTSSGTRRRWRPRSSTVTSSEVTGFGRRTPD